MGQDMKNGGVGVLQIPSDRIMIFMKRGEGGDGGEEFSKQMSTNFSSRKFPVYKVILFLAASL